MRKQDYEAQILVSEKQVERGFDQEGSSNELSKSSNPVVDYYRNKHYVDFSREKRNEIFKNGERTKELLKRHILEIANSIERLSDGGKVSIVFLWEDIVYDYSYRRFEGYHNHAQVDSVGSFYIAIQDILDDFRENKIDYEFFPREMRVAKVEFEEQKLNKETEIWDDEKLRKIVQDVGIVFDDSTKEYTRRFVIYRMNVRMPDGVITFDEQRISFNDLEKRLISTKEYYSGDKGEIVDVHITKIEDERMLDALSGYMKSEKDNALEKLLNNEVNSILDDLNAFYGLGPLDDSALSALTADEWKSMFIERFKPYFEQNKGLKEKLDGLVPENYNIGESLRRWVLNVIKKLFEGVK